MHNNGGWRYCISTESKNWFYITLWIYIEFLLQSIDVVTFMKHLHLFKKKNYSSATITCRKTFSTNYTSSNYVVAYLNMISSCFVSTWWTYCSQRPALRITAFINSFFHALYRCLIINYINRLAWLICIIDGSIIIPQDQCRAVFFKIFLMVFRNTFKKYIYVLYLIMWNCTKQLVIIIHWKVGLILAIVISNYNCIYICKHYYPLLISRRHPQYRC